jgi:hypothetical protein
LNDEVPKNVTHLPLTADELNRLVNARSLKGTDTAELLNERPHPKEKESETEPLLLRN